MTLNNGVSSGRSLGSPDAVMFPVQRIVSDVGSSFAVGASAPSTLTNRPTGAYPENWISFRPFPTDEIPPWEIEELETRQPYKDVDDFHAQGITGSGVRVMSLEDYRRSSHAATTTGVIQQLAPGAEVFQMGYDEIPDTYRLNENNLRNTPVQEFVRATSSNFYSDAAGALDRARAEDIQVVTTSAQATHADYVMYVRDMLGLSGGYGRELMFRGMGISQEAVQREVFGNNPIPTNRREIDEKINAYVQRIHNNDSTIQQARQTYDQALQTFHDEGGTLFVVAGNEGERVTSAVPDQTGPMLSNPLAVGVGATDIHDPDRVADYSSAGPNVDLTETPALDEGTSFAAPAAAATAALMLQRAKDLGYTLEPGELVQIMTQTTNPLEGDATRTGAGDLNPVAAMRELERRAGAPPRP
ncbi:MAG: hypothetical protein SFZ03_01045 [Candidatus Melainabacteria bacterium]|nr:hypothetical protein [Candidatus Melainabacteria bacterium]